MTADRWREIQSVLEAVEECDGSRREEVLDRLCGSDRELRGEVVSLLAYEGQLEVFERAPVVNLPEEPRQIGPYRIERLLGAGGMGAVYLAQRSDGQYRKQVAIKILHRAGPQLVQRFRTERQILAQLDHPYIARLVDGGELGDGRLFLVMDYVEGEPVDEYVGKRAEPLDDVLRLFLKICAAVQFAHEHLVVHRDLKAGNILITPEGEPRLLDFGIAKALSPESDVYSTQSFEKVMTPSSASPEQIAGGPITTASDVYSLGALLYRLLTGASPHGESRTAAEAMRAVLERDPIPASAVRGRSLRGDLDNILAKALEKDPARRYRRVDEFAADIRFYLDGRPVLAKPTTALYRARKFARRNRVWVGFGCALTLAVGLGVSGSLWYARKARAEKALAVQRFERLRKLSESLVFDVHDAIRDLPGATQARALLVRRAAESLDQLAAEAGDDRAVLRDLASAYARLAAIQSGERGPHLGGSSAPRDGLATYRKALAIRQRLASAEPNNRALANELLDSMWSVAQGYVLVGDLERALTLDEERLTVIEEMISRRGWTEFEYNRATSLMVIADLHRQMGDPDAAIAGNRNALALREKLLRADPGSARLRRAVGISHEYLGYALQTKEDFAAATREHQASLALFETMLAATPASIDLQRMVQVAHTNLCETLAATGAREKSLPHCRAGVALSEAMLRADPNNVQALEDLGAAQSSIGVGLQRTGQPEEAVRWAKRSIAVYRTAMAKDPDSIETATGYAKALLLVAELERRSGAADPCPYVLVAESEFQRLAAVSPKNAAIQSSLWKTREFVRASCHAVR